MTNKAAVCVQVCVWTQALFLLGQHWGWNCRVLGEVHVETVRVAGPFPTAHHQCINKCVAPHPGHLLCCHLGSFWKLGLPPSPGIALLLRGQPAGAQAGDVLRSPCWSSFASFLLHDLYKSLTSLDPRFLICA